jgi:squalene-associated FAD-dependent desaturase
VAPGRVAVVGGGLAGLSAVLSLKRDGYETHLFERARLLGGKATSFEVGGTVVDNGQHVILACCTEFIDFIGSLEALDPGGAPLLRLQRRFDALVVYRGGTARLREVPLPAPMHLAVSLARYGVVDLRTRISIGRAVLAARGPARSGETFADWLDRHQQSSAARTTFWEPFLVPALNAAPADVAAEDALFVVRTAFLRAGAARFGFSRVPLGEIARRAGRAADRVALRSPVVGVRVEGGHVAGVMLEDHIEPFDAVILAVPPSRLRTLLGTPEDFGIHHLEQFRTAPIVDVHLWLDRQSLEFEFAALLESPVQWVFEKGPGYVCCSMSAAERYVSWKNDDLIALCREELARALPHVRDAHVLRGAVTRDREATFVPTPGLRRPGARTAVAGLALAGAWTDTGWPATMESAVRSGRQAAAVIKADWEGSSGPGA